jgi:hypothetical protein
MCFDRVPLFTVLPRLRGRCPRLARAEEVRSHEGAMTPSVADYRDTSPEDGGGR